MLANANPGLSQTLRLIVLISPPARGETITHPIIIDWKLRRTIIRAVQVTGARTVNVVRANAALLGVVALTKIRGRVGNPLRTRHQYPAPVRVIVFRPVVTK
jgi:hypothetical protein